MKLRFALILIASLISSAATAFASAEKAGTSTNTVAAKPAVTNAALTPIPIATSKFNIPSTTAEGRDPFFPNSARLQAGSLKPADPSGKGPAVALLLKGIGGSRENRVALINTKTFKVGDIEPVTVNGVRVQVSCISIGEDSVVVEVNGVRQELRLPQGF